MPPAPLLAVLPFPSIAELLPCAWARQRSPRTTRRKRPESQIALDSNCSVPSCTPPQSQTVGIVPPSITYSDPDAVAHGLGHPCLKIFRRSGRTFFRIPGKKDFALKKCDSSPTSRLLKDSERQSSASPSLVTSSWNACPVGPIFVYGFLRSSG